MRRLRAVFKYDRPDGQSKSCNQNFFGITCFCVSKNHGHSVQKKSKNLSKRKISKLYNHLVRLFLGLTEVPQSVIRYHTPKSISQIVNLFSLGAGIFGTH